MTEKEFNYRLGHESENMSLYYAYTTESERLDAVNKRKPS